MIDNILKIPTCFLGLGLVQYTTAIPAIEAALRTIFGVGQLIHNRGQYLYTKCGFGLEEAFSLAPSYLNIQRDFLQEVRNSLLNSSLPQTCAVDQNLPNNKTLTLQYENSALSSTVDLNAFKAYCGTYKTLSEDFNLFQKRAGFDLDNQTDHFTIPAFFDEKSFHLLTDYLQTRAIRVYNTTPDVKTNGLKKIIGLYKLADYLQMDDLKARCVERLKGLIDSGTIDIDQYGREINLEDHEGEFHDLLISIKQFKQVYKQTSFQDKILKINAGKDQIIRNTVSQLFYTMVLTACSAVPIVGPIYFYANYDSNKYLSDEYYPSLSVKIIHALPSLLLDATKPALVLTAQSVSFLAQAVFFTVTCSLFGLFIACKVTANVLFSALSNIAKVIYYVAKGVFKVTAFIVETVFDVVSIVAKSKWTVLAAGGYLVTLAFKNGIAATVSQVAFLPIHAGAAVTTFVAGGAFKIITFVAAPLLTASTPTLIAVGVVAIILLK